MFYISISNGLIEGDHHDKMGNAIWLYMWLIDKVTRIDEDGYGWVLGGKPIKLEEIKHIPRRTVQRYISILKKNEYIKATYTMRGVILKVSKAKKSFGRRTPKVAHLDTPDLAHHDAKSGAPSVKSGAPNKTVQYDKTTRQDNSAPSAHAEIVEIIDLFKPINPAYQNWFKNTTERSSIEQMLKIHGKDQVIKVIGILPKTNQIAYLPTITKPTELENKWAALEAGLVKLKNKSKSNQPKVAFS